MKAYAKLYCKKQKINSDGLAPIYFVIRIGSKEKLIATGKYIKPEYFNNGGGGEVTNKRNYAKLNIYLENEKNKINDIILDLQYKSVNVNFEIIINRYKQSDESESFLKFAFSELEKMKPAIAKRTYEDYYYSLNSLVEYSQGITFRDLDVKFLTQFDVWLKTVKNRNQNSRVRNFTAIRRFLNLAINYGLTTNYPFNKFKFSQKKVEREYLREDELNQLQSLFDNNTLSNKLQNTLANFLFTCYTGIAADDMKNKDRLKFNCETVTFKRGKTGEFIKVPLSLKAKALAPEIQTRNLKQKHGKITEDLKVIMNEVGINKHITYHCGRHTFAIISLMKGISLSVISKVLGHTTTKTTEIYAKVVDELLNKEMAMWDD